MYFMNPDLFVVTELGISAQLEAMCIKCRKIRSRPTDKLHIYFFFSLRNLVSGLQIIEVIKHNVECPGRGTKQYRGWRGKSSVCYLQDHLNSYLKTHNHSTRAKKAFSKFGGRESFSAATQDSVKLGRLPLQPSQSTPCVRYSLVKKLLFLRIN